MGVLVVPLPGWVSPLFLHRDGCPPLFLRCSSPLFPVVPRCSIWSALLALSLLATAAAAPITLAFEAEISSVVKSQGADFNLAVNEGDKFTGTFTFEPVSPPPI